MPQTVDRVDFVCPDVDPSQWPRLSCGAANQLALQEGSLRLDAAREILFQGNGQICSFDDNHRLVFDRTNDRLELHEIGDIRFLTGAPAPNERLRIQANGNVGIGTDTPAERLHVAGNLRITDDATIAGNLNAAGTTDLGGTLQVGGNVQVRGILNAAGIQQNGTPLTSSQWANVAAGIHFGGGNVGIGTASPQSKLSVVAGTSDGLNVNHNNDNVWAIRLSNSQNATFETGMRVTDDGFFEVTNAIGRFTGIARLNSTGTWTVSSDQRLKEEVEPAVNLLEKALALKPMHFYYANQDREELPHKFTGFIAQDVEAICPHLVVGTKTKTLDYSGLIPVAIGAIQEMKQAYDQKIANLNIELEQLKKQILHREEARETMP